MVKLGILGGTVNVDEKKWDGQIDIAERMLVYFYAPPYNTQYLDGYGEIPDSIVLNLDKKNRLPFEVSTYYENTPFWDESGNWREYSMD